MKKARKPAKKLNRKKPGQPTKYDEAMNEQVFKYSLLGLTDEQMAPLFNVSERTFNNWKELHPQFLQSIKDGKEKADAEITKSLYHRAKGYSHPDVHISNYQGTITTTPLTKHYPPDTAAAFIWLKNRQGDKWKDRKEVEIDETVDLKEIADAIRKSHTSE